MAATERVAPALTPDEWQRRCIERGQDLAYMQAEQELVLRWRDPEGVWDHGSVTDTEVLHGVAALCLRGRPFGFTWNDVDDVRREATWLEDEPLNSTRECGARLRAIGERIAALLPPRNA